MKTPKTIKLSITKSAKGYSVKDKTGLDLFDDSDTGRNALIEYLCVRLLNAKVKDGSKYK